MSWTIRQHWQNELKRELAERKKRDEICSTLNIDKELFDKISHMISINLPCQECERRKNKEMEDYDKECWARSESMGLPTKENK